ncbi:hypothetical protein M422DRAFT_156259 [Sphaerobolus stellatus SS14]|nr:hypothetical protein M422DRAFT_156259 [Sphaerobolus stellatus SS14]
MRELEEKMRAALQSREDRQILRRLPSGTTSLVDFCSNDYLSLSTNPDLRRHFLGELQKSRLILGSGGSRLLTDVPGHDQLEKRLAKFFNAPSALLFNSGFDANAGFFSCVPQPGDVIFYDEYIHASVHDGMRASRVRESLFVFEHNSLKSLEEQLNRIIQKRPGIAKGTSSAFITVESLYSMDGDFAPLQSIVDLVEKLLPHGNGHIIVDEAHSTGLYGEQGRGIVSLLGLENRVTARLHTFGKALAGSGAVMLTTPLLRHYMINFARPLIYTTALSRSSVINVSCSFDILQSDIGGQLSAHLTNLCVHFVQSLRQYLRNSSTTLVYLPAILCSTELATPKLISPIIPILTSSPRPLSAYLQKRGYLTRPITHPTVPKGLDRVRICLHAGNTLEQVNGLIRGIIDWVESQTITKAEQVATAKL